jgi:3-dehydroquinate dehydratase-2
MKILVINGPNLNLLGTREPGIYGSQSYADLERLIRDHAAKLSCEVEIFQTNHEGVIVDKIQEAGGKFDGLVINPAAYTHTSVAIPDAISAVKIPAVEVLISDITKREAIRQVSYTSAVCIKTIVGHGFAGYIEAIDLLQNGIL